MFVNPSIPASSRVSAKYLFFALVGIMTAYVLVHVEGFLLDPASPQWQHYAPVRWWLLPHAFAGTCAVIVAPRQFSDRLRRRNTTLHRVMGRDLVIQWQERRVRR